jgi:hypothetical protein
MYRIRSTALARPHSLDRTTDTELLERRWRLDAGAFRFGAARADAGRESIQHSLHVVDRVEDRPRLISLGESKITGEVRLESELTRLSASEIERVEKLPVPLPTTAFGDVAADRDCTSAHLRRHPEPFTRREGGRQSVNGYGQRSGLLEHE